MKMLDVTLKTRLDVYKFAITLGASELLAEVIASETVLPISQYAMRDFETPLAAFIIETTNWSRSDIGYDFWNSMYESLLIFDK